MFELFKNKKPDNPPPELSNEELSDVINGFSVFVEQAETNTFYDVDKLYHPKRTIQFALVSGIANGDTEEFRTECEVALNILAQFHEGVGEEPLRNTTFDQIHGSPRWNMFNKIYEEETERSLIVIQAIKEKTNNHQPNT